MAPFPCSVTAHHGVSRFLTVAGIPVRLTIFDPHYSAEWSESIVFSYPRLVLMIPGNPGEIGYYDQLMALVHDRCNLPVIGVSYAGHNPLPDNRKLPGDDPLSLDRQVEYKCTFIRKHISASTRLILAAHSIGCYVCIELFKEPDINRMIEHFVGILPTIEDMASTETGKRTTRLIGSCGCLVMCLVRLVHWTVPLAVKRMLARWVVSNGVQQTDPASSIPEHVLDAALNLFNPACLKATVRMAICEFEQVKQPDFAAINSAASRISLLYGERDHWCPPEYYHHIRAECPQADLRLCLGDIDHAFVCDPIATRVIAEMVSKLVLTKPALISKSQRSTSR